MRWIAVVALVAAASPAAAQTREQLWNVCADDNADHDAAIRACSGFLELPNEPDSNRSIVFYNRGLGYHRKKDFDRALRDYDRALQLGRSATAAACSWTGASTGAPSSTATAPSR